jgi:hypothetical protein
MGVPQHMEADGRHDARPLAGLAHETDLLRASVVEPSLPYYAVKVEARGLGASLRHSQLRFLPLLFFGHCTELHDIAQSCSRDRSPSAAVRQIDGLGCRGCDVIGD